MERMGRDRERYPLRIRVATLQSWQGIRRAHSFKHKSNLLSSNNITTVFEFWEEKKKEEEKQGEKEVQENEKVRNRVDILYS
jgi:hypothetical protein